MLSKRVCRQCVNFGFPTDPSDLDGRWLCWDDKNCSGFSVSRDHAIPEHCPMRLEHLMKLDDDAE